MIVDAGYYNDLLFSGGDDLQALEKALGRAERLIDLITCGKCGEFGSLPEEKRNQLKYAVCAQAEKYLTDGFDGGEIDCKVRIGDFSYESRDNGIIGGLSPTAAAALRLSGLLYMGTGVR